MSEKISLDSSVSFSLLFFSKWAIRHCYDLKMEFI